MFVLYLALFYLAANIGGWLIEKIKIPKIYAALFLGIALSGYAAAQEFASTEIIKSLSLFGEYTLLFLLGYGLSFRKIRDQARLVVKTTFWIILSETVFGVLVLHMLFGVDWFLAIIIGLSFATVGEISLLPILEEFKLLRTRFGQLILGVAVIDDVVEVAAFFLLLFFLGGAVSSEFWGIIAPVVLITVGALVGNLLKRSVKFEKWLKFFAYYVVGPLFFFFAGMSSDLNLLFKNLPLILLLVLGVKLIKIVTAYFATHKKIGTKKSIVLGVCTGIKFSTSIILLLIILQKGLIDAELFSILLGMKVVFKITVPTILSVLLTKWKSEF